MLVLMSNVTLKTNLRSVKSICKGWGLGVQLAEEEKNGIEKEIINQPDFYFGQKHLLGNANTAAEKTW